MYRVYRVYSVYRVHRAHSVNSVNSVYRVYRVYSVYRGYMRTLCHDIKAIIAILFVFCYAYNPTNQAPRRGRFRFCE